MSPMSVLAPRMGLMGTKSTPTMRDDTGMFLAATCARHGVGGCQGAARCGGCASAAVHAARSAAVAPHLQPSSWGRAQVEQRPAVAEEVVLAVELDELEGGTGTVPAREPPHRPSREHWLPQVATARNLHLGTEVVATARPSSITTGDHHALAPPPTPLALQRRPLTPAPWPSDRTCPDAPFPSWSSAPSFTELQLQSRLEREQGKHQSSRQHQRRRRSTNTCAAASDARSCAPAASSLPLLAASRRRQGASVAQRACVHEGLALCCSYAYDAAVLVVDARVEVRSRAP